MSRHENENLEKQSNLNSDQNRLVEGDGTAGTQSKYGDIRSTGSL